jgi:hypothetical protein
MLNVCRYQRYRIFSHSGTIWTTATRTSSSGGRISAAGMRKTMSVWYAWSAGVRTTNSRAVAAADARIKKAGHWSVVCSRPMNGSVTAAAVIATATK